MSGNVGATGALLKAVTFDSASCITTTVGGDVFATTITVDGSDATGIVSFSGSVNGTTLNIATDDAVVNFAADKNVSLAITATDADDGTLNFAGTTTVSGLVGVIGGNELNLINIDGGTVTFSSNVASTTITVDAGATLKTSDARSIEAATVLNNSGTLDVGGTLTLTGTTIEFGAAASTSLVTLGQASAYTGSVVLSAVASTANATNALTVTPHASFTSGTLTLVDTNAGAGTADDTAKWSINNTALTSYAVTVDGSSDVILTATQNSASSIASSLGVTTSAGEALGVGVNATSGDATVTAAYNTALTAGGTAAANAAEQSEPTQSSGASAAMGSTGTTTMNVVSSRLASVRDGRAFASRGHTGFAAGGGIMSKAVWMRPFTNFADQSERNDADGGAVDGYDATTWGVAGGFDAMVTDKTRLGISFTYANTDVDGDGVQNDTTDISSYQGTFYGDYTTDKYYIEGMLAYAYNDVDTSRDITFGGLNRTAKGSYSANQYTVRIGAGMPLGSKHVITPTIALQYTHVDNDSYTETGAGAMNLTVDPEDLDIALGILGLKYQTSYDVNNGRLTPQLRASISYDFSGDDADSVSRFTGATTTFTTKGVDVAQFAGAIGAGMTYSTKDGRWDVSADYDADLKADYVGHTGRIEAKYKF